jgi:competence protein ComEC
MKTVFQVLTSVLLCASMLVTYASAGEKDGRFDLYWIDVEGGAATLMVTPKGESVLIDTGYPGPRDTGRVVEVATRVAGLKQLDHVIITHYHIDHFGGAVLLSQLMPIKTLYDNGTFEGQTDFPSKEYLELKCGKRVVINPGYKIPLQSLKEDGSQLSLTCIGTRQKFIELPAGTAANTEICANATEQPRDGSDNANSVVTLLQFGDFRFFDAGDLTWNTEFKAVCPVNLVGQVDVYQTTHHGLDTSNNPLILRSLQPTVAIMNNGPVKGGMAPVFKTLGETKSIEALYQVHKSEHEASASHNVAAEYIANGQADCKGNYIHLSVDPKSETYTVNIPANKHSRTFKTKTAAK